MLSFKHALTHFLQSTYSITIYQSFIWLIFKNNELIFKTFSESDALSVMDELHKKGVKTVILSRKDNYIRKMVNGNLMLDLLVSKGENETLS